MLASIARQNKIKINGYLGGFIAGFFNGQQNY